MPSRRSIDRSTISPCSSIHLKLVAPMAKSGGDASSIRSQMSDERLQPKGSFRASLIESRERRSLDQSRYVH